VTDAAPVPVGPAAANAAERSPSVQRSRMRTLRHTQSVVDAARRLIREKGESFTIQEVAKEAGVALQTFYRCFAGKDELLVALFAQDARRGAAALAAMVDAAVDRDEPEEPHDGRLPYAAALVREHLRLAESRPEELRDVLHPFVDLFADELRRAQAAGVIRAGHAERDARTLFHLVVSHLHALICHQIDDPPAAVGDDLWAFCAAALRPT